MRVAGFASITMMLGVASCTSSGDELRPGDAGQGPADVHQADAAAEDAAREASVDTGSERGAADAVVETGDGPLTDAGVDGGGTVAGRWRAGVRGIIAREEFQSTCASVLPAVPAPGVTEMRAATGAFVASQYGVAPADVAMTVPACGRAGGTTCARVFQHDVYKSNGLLGERLYAPVAELEALAADVEVTHWTPMRGELTLPTAVCIAGRLEGELLGVILFNDPPPCP